MKVILDTNFLIYCAREKFDYVEAIQNLLNENYDLIVPEQVIEELEKLKIHAKKGKDKAGADLALQLLQANKVKKISVRGKDVDEGIINLANQDEKNIVCTLDRGMRHILKRVILINRRKKLMLTK